MIDLFGRKAKREIKVLERQLSVVKEQREYWMARARDLELRSIPGTAAYQASNSMLSKLYAPNHEWLEAQCRAKISKLMSANPLPGA